MGIADSKQSTHEMSYGIHWLIFTRKYNLDIMKKKSARCGGTSYNPSIS